jgi:hypothetical protein
MQIESGSRKQRMHVLTCTAYQRRGPTACTFRGRIPMRAAEDAVLDVLAEDVLQPDRVAAAIDRAIEVWLAGQTDRAVTRARLETRLTVLSREIANLTAALANGVPAGPVAEALAARDAERQHLERECAALDAVPAVTTTDRAALISELGEILSDWRKTLRTETAAARPLLRKLLSGRVTFVPEDRNGQSGYRLAGTGTIKALLPTAVQTVVRHVPESGAPHRAVSGFGQPLRLAQAVVPKVVPVRGFEPRFRG